MGLDVVPTDLLRWNDRFAANYHLGHPLPNELAEMIASHIPRCDVHSCPWTAGYNDDRQKSRSPDCTRLWPSGMDATFCSDECPSSGYLSEMLVDPKEALKEEDEEHRVKRRSSKGIIEEDDPDDGIDEPLPFERHPGSYSSSKWFNDVLYSPDWRQSSWITLARGGMRKSEPCRDLMIRFAGFGSANGGADRKL